MSDNNEKVIQLMKKWEILMQKQENFQKEIHDLRIEIEKLKYPDPIEQPQTVQIVEPKIKIEESIQIESAISPELTSIKKENISTKSTQKTDFEKFIGENLINKIGIIITVIGVGIGAKYSIENNLISPLTRIILGYISGIVMMGVGIKLKEKYENFSAVLVSGALAVFYLITFSAYNFYHLFPQTLAFVLMVVFTVFGVVAALHYKRQVIAIIGLVGAYAVPFLLSNDSGNMQILFSYMAIINIGILIIAVKKYWKALHYAAFFMTWMIFMFWFASDYDVKQHFSATLLFLSIFFLIFYATFLAYKLYNKEKFLVDDIILLLLNSFIFYGYGYYILNRHQIGENFLGLFTLANAVLHFIVSSVIYRQKLGDKNLFYLIIGLVLTFITITIPVQLDGHWVTLLWVAETTLLFWIGRTKHIKFYETLSYVMIFLAFFSIIYDWVTLYDTYYPNNPKSYILPIFNSNFLTSLLFIVAFGYINWLNYKTFENLKPNWVIRFFIPFFFLIALFFSLRIEISNYFDQLFQKSNSVFRDNYVENYNIIHFKNIWLYHYTLVFVAILALINFFKIKNQKLSILSVLLIIITLISFLTEGFQILGNLRENYVDRPTISNVIQIGFFNIGVRYISIILAGINLYILYIYFNSNELFKKFIIHFELFAALVVIWIASNELINWMDLAHSTKTYKLGLSILWGISSLSLIILGIWKNKQHLRIGAIALFAITLIKLFFYDLTYLNTISKTIVFLSLGVLLLFISFLYNKYKNLITDED